jgi:UDP-N-acetylmuramate--alanine ligase
MMQAELDQPRKVLVVGVGGAGMSALAFVLAQMGHVVVGSDLKDSGALSRLRAAGIEVWVGHDPSHLDGIDVVVVSGAIPPHNPELEEARRRGLPVLSRGDVVSWLSRKKRTIAVSGTHGKTTTTWMLARILHRAGWAPAYLVGGELNESGANGAWGDGAWLVAEADESDGTFLRLSAELAILTSLEPDHLDYYQSFDRLEAAARHFLAQAELALASADFPAVAKIASELGARTFGISESATYRYFRRVIPRQGQEVVLEAPGGLRCRFVLGVPGPGNAADAAAAAAAALMIGVSPAAIEEALQTFVGVARRLQFRGSANGWSVVDDYAHLPGEVKAGLAALREEGYRRVIAVFQPHRFSRTEALAAEFAGAFDGADVVVITDVYGAGEAPRPGVSGKLVYEAVAASHPKGEVLYVDSRAQVAEAVKKLLEPGDVLVLMGAGDISLVADELLEGS